MANPSRQPRTRSIRVTGGIVARLLTVARTVHQRPAATASRPIARNLPTWFGPRQLNSADAPRAAPSATLGWHHGRLIRTSLRTRRDVPVFFSNSARFFPANSPARHACHAASCTSNEQVNRLHSTGSPGPDAPRREVGRAAAQNGSIGEGRTDIVLDTIGASEPVQAPQGRAIRAPRAAPRRAIARNGATLGTRPGRTR